MIQTGPAGYATARMGVPHSKKTITKILFLCKGAYSSLPLVIPFIKIYSRLNFVYKE